MRYLSLGEALELHRRIIEQAEGITGLRDLGGFESAITQPRAAFEGEEGA